MTLYWHEDCITDFHGHTFPTLFLSYFAQKVGEEGPLDPPPALSLSVFGIRMFSSMQKNGLTLMCDVCHKQKKT